MVAGRPAVAVAAGGSAFAVDLAGAALLAVVLAGAVVAGAVLAGVVLAAADRPATTKATQAPARQAATSKTVKKVEPPARPERPAAEVEQIRSALIERRDELKAEHELTMAELAEAQRDRLADSAGDDQADTGTKTFEREQEITLANNLRDRIGQVERALDRLELGQYGWCEKCGNAIPVERLAAFPSATLCVTCKQLEERR